MGQLAGVSRAGFYRSLQERTQPILHAIQPIEALFRLDPFLDFRVPVA
jgi:DNA-binding phage protein